MVCVIFLDRTKVSVDLSRVNLSDRNKYQWSLSYHTVDYENGENNGKDRTEREAKMAFIAFNVPCRMPHKILGFCKARLN
jgi:hypothetical protein